MKRVVFFLFFLLSVNHSFAQFSDTIELNTYIRETFRDRRPDKVTAAQLQKALLGTTKFLNSDFDKIHVSDTSAMLSPYILGGSNGLLLSDKTLSWGGSLNVPVNMDMNGNSIRFTSCSSYNDQFGVRIADADNPRFTDFFIDKNGINLLTNKDSKNVAIYLQNNSPILVEDTYNQTGMMYNSDYSELGTHIPRWIPDIAAVRKEISDSLATAGGGSSYTFENGLVQSGGAVKLGGTVTESTVINTGSNLFVINGEGIMGIQGGDFVLFKVDQETMTVMGFATTADADFLVADDIGRVGLKYTSDYSANGLLYDRWIPDIAAVRKEINDSINSDRRDTIVSKIIIMQPFQLSGTIEITSGTDLVQGHNTKFLSEFNLGDTIQADGQECIILTLVNDSVLYTIEHWANDYSGSFNISAGMNPRFRFAFNPNGNLGIGTPDPKDKLEIIGNNINGALSPAIRFTDNGTESYSRILFDGLENTLYFNNPSSNGRFSFNRRVSINGNITAHNLDWGTWEPVISAENNVSGSTISECRYSLLGNIITISGVITLGTTTDDEASLEFDLPYLSAFARASDLSGSGSDVTLSTPVHFSLSANTSNGNARLGIKDFAGSTTGAKFSFTGQFILLEE